MGDMGILVLFFFCFFLFYFSKFSWEVFIPTFFLNNCFFLFSFRQIERSETIYIFASLGESAMIRQRRVCTKELTCFLRLVSRFWSFVPA